jgi:hypothetical protein
LVLKARYGAPNLTVGAPSASGAPADPVAIAQVPAAVVADDRDNTFRTVNSTYP